MRLVWMAGLVCLLIFPVAATPIGVDFKNAEIPPNATQVALPYLLNNVSDTVFLKFKIPDIASVASIDAFEITVTLFDNGDRGGETGEFQFALPSGPNLELGTFGPNLNGTTQQSPITFTFDLSPDQIALVFPSILDGNFRIKVIRDTGDFNVAGGTATIDGTLLDPETDPVPEPGTLATIGIGFLLVIAGIRRRRRALQSGQRT